MTKITKVEFLEALICSNILRAVQQETEALKRGEDDPRPLSSIEAERGLGHAQTPSVLPFNFQRLLLGNYEFSRGMETTTDKGSQGVDFQKHTKLDKSLF